MLFQRKQNAEPPGGGTPSGIERAQIAFRRAFWVCAGCKQEFRFDRDKSPVCCPRCGRTRNSSLGNVPKAELWLEESTCPKCQAVIEMVDGEHARFCPSCGWGIK